jgi:mannose-6-phosphate isomerase-like protein (cupin superfamily)
MYTTSGSGSLTVAGESHELGPGTAAYVTTGESYEVDNQGLEDLVIVSATAPQSADEAQVPTARTGALRRPADPPRERRP